MSSYNVPLEPIVVEEAKRYLADLQASQGINKSMRQMIAEAVVEYLNVRGYLGGNLTYADFIRTIKQLEKNYQPEFLKYPYATPAEKAPGQHRGGRSAKAVLTWAKSIVARRRTE
jgi:hypothetical protein